MTAEISLEDQKFIRSYRADYLLRMCSVFFIYLLVTMIFFVFDEAENTITDFMGTIIFLLFWNVIVTGIGAWILFLKIRNQFYRKDDRLKKSIRNLPFQSILLVGTISFLYCLIIGIVGTQTKPEEYKNAFGYIDFIFSISYSYLVIPLYFVWLSQNSLLMKIKRRLYKLSGLEFSEARRKFRNDVLLTFLIISVLPVITIFTSLISSGFMVTIIRQNPNLFSYLIILVVGVVFTVFSQTQSFSRPINELSDFVNRLREGKYHLRLPVTVENEIGLLTDNINQMAAGLEEREKIKDLFGRMVDPVIRDHILMGNVNLGGAITEGTILFSDIRGFTTLSEKMEPEKVVELLNLYFEKMSRSIQQSKGLVNKYIGDAIMAIFGILVESEYQADHAVNAAVEMQKSLRVLNDEFRKTGLPEIRTGIGIHKGKVLAGNIGSSSRMEYTVIGDSVNVASRIEGLTKYFANGVVVSDEVRSGFKGIYDFHYRFLTKIRVKGRSTPVSLYEVLDGLPGLEKELKIKTAAEFEAGVNLYYQKDIAGAQKIFLPLLRTLPDDKILLHYSQRSELLLREGIPENWNGIENS